jgi:signal transduction histidine kinase
MFDYTMTAVEKIKRDFQRIMFACSVLIQGLYVAYLIVALCLGVGNTIVNGVLLGLCSAYLGFYLVMNFRESRGAKKTKKIVETLYRRSKQLIKFYTLAASIYAIWLTGDNANHFTVLITALMLVSFVLQILLEIVYKLVVDRLQLLVEGVKKDIAPAIKTVNFFKKLKGEEIEPEEEKNKHREWLDKNVVDYRTQRAEEKAAKQRALKEKKAAKKQAEKEEKQRLALEKKQSKQAKQVKQKEAKKK